MVEPVPTRRSLVGATVIASMLISVAPLVAQNANVPHCLDLALGAWSGERGGGADSLLFSPPPRILLDPAREGDRWAEGLGIRPAPGGLPSIHPHSTWRQEGDTLRLAWSTGFSGLSVRLVRSGDLYRGQASTFTDVIGAPQAAAEITATPVDCAAPLRHALDDQRPIPRTVPLEAPGDTLVLGKPLGTALVAGPSGLGFRIRGEPGGLFAGATEVRVLATEEEGRVRSIRMPYADGTDYTALVARITQQLGPPNYRHERENSQGATWENRTTRLYISRAKRTDGGWRMEAMLTDPRIRG